VKKKKMNRKRKRKKRIFSISSITKTNIFKKKNEY